MGKCRKCKNYEKEIQGCLYMDADCKNGENFEPITNYDRIKSMSVEEMAVYLVEEHEYGVAHETYFVCPDGMEFDEDKYKEAIEYTKQWLLQEVSENDD